MDLNGYTGPLGLKKFAESDQDAYKVVSSLARDVCDSACKLRAQADAICLVQRMMERASQGRTVAKLAYRRIRDSKHTVRFELLDGGMDVCLLTRGQIRLRAEYSKSIQRKLENLRFVVVH
eukprot:758375-Hanusia_phi.AAC.2